MGPILGIIAIITGARGKKAIDSSGGTKTGRGSATAGVILGIINVVLSVLVGGLIVLALSLARNHTSYTHLQAGDCYNRSSSNIFFRDQVDRVDCTAAHDTEVTGTFEATGGDYPGADGFRPQAQTQCASLADQYLGGTSGQGLNFVWLAPNQTTWDDGIHTVVCGLQNSDRTRHVGSVRG